MWHVYIADEKGERFSLVAGRIPYLLTKVQLLLAKINWLICDVIPDYHLIVGRQNRTSNPQEQIFPSKWSEPSVMWYIYTSDGKHFVSFSKDREIFWGNYQMEQLLTK